MAGRLWDFLFYFFKKNLEIWGHFSPERQKPHSAVLFFISSCQTLAKFRGVRYDADSWSGVGLHFCLLNKVFSFLALPWQVTPNVVSDNRNVSLTVLEARSLKSRCQLGHLPPKVLEDDLSSPLPAPGGYRHSFACGCVTSIFASTFTGPSPRCLWIPRTPASSSHKATSH